MKRSIVSVFAIIAILCLRVAAAAAHTFALDTASWQTQPTSVNVAGDFNGWNMQATPLKKDGTVWSANVDLRDGLHTYKFVIDNSRWITDPKADPTLDADDGNGGKNSGVRVAKDGAATASKGYTFSLDTSSWDQKPKSINVAGDFNAWNKDATPMKQTGQVWSVTVPLSNGPHAYKFIADGERWLTDPKADPSLETDDGNGGKNSGVVVGAAADKPANDAPAKGQKSQNGHLFALDTSAWQEQPRTVNLAGDFNGWNNQSISMQKNGTTWSASVPLEDGIHAYKFVVDGNRWINDPKADATFEADDGNGGHNSGVLIGPDARKLPPPQPNAINADGLLHDPAKPEYANVDDPNQIRLRIKTQANDVESVAVKLIGASDLETPLHKLGSDMGYDSFGGLVDTSESPAKYVFVLRDGTKTIYFGKAGVSDDLSKAQPFESPMRYTFVTPDWAAHAVWYQIFPERFRNGDTSNDPTTDADEHPVRWTSKWFDTQPGEAPGAQNFYEGRGEVWKRRYGGDIQGIREELPYLRKLGINAIYLNPIFEAASMHKYDTTDYRHVDEHFGVKGDWPVAGETDDPATWKWSASDKVFLDFLADAHAQGFKVVIDGVFNHVGRPNPFFQDVLEHGKNSRYANSFEITDWGNPANWHKMDNPYAIHGKPGGIQWKAWDGLNGALPVWKKSNETGLVAGPYEHIMAITRRWLAPDGDPSRGVDGFRLDAANEVPHPFWVAWRKVVKDTKPDAFIAGEIWSPAQPWINDGKEFDAVMNYQFAMPTLQFFANNKKAISPTDYAEKMTNLIYMYPEQASRVMMNLFDSHDTDRVASMFVNADRDYDSGDRLQDPEGKNYNPRKPNALERTRMLQAVAMQMTFLGAPMIYYGDEAGMWSPDDPSDRQPMTWPEMKFDDPEVAFNPQIFDYYRRLIAVRAVLPELQTGDFYPVLADDGSGTIVFARGSDAKHAYVVFNRSSSPKTVTFKVSEKDAGRSFINYADPGSLQMTDPAIDGRTTIAVKSDATPVKADGASLTVTVGAYGDAILAERP